MVGVIKNCFTCAKRWCWVIQKFVNDPVKREQNWIKRPSRCWKDIRMFVSTYNRRGYKNFWQYVVVKHLDVEITIRIKITHRSAKEFKYHIKHKKVDYRDRI